MKQPVVFNEASDITANLLKPGYSPVKTLIVNDVRVGTSRDRKLERIRSL